MDWKQIIRWSSEGGDKVKSEFKDVGDAAQKTGEKIDESTKKVGASAAAAQRAATAHRGMGDATRTAAVGITGMDSAMAAFNRTLAAYLAPTAIYAAIKAGADYASTILDGANAAGLGIGSYQKLTFAMTQSGLSAQQADLALASFNSKLGDAARGNTKLAETFQMLGVNVDKVAAGQMTTQEALSLTVRSLSEIEDAAIRASTAADVFGEKAGRKMAAFAGQGADEIERLKEQAESLGIVLSDDMVKAAEEAGDQISALIDLMKVGLAAAVGDSSDLIKGLSGWVFYLSEKMTAALSPFDEYLKRHQLLAQIIRYGGITGPFNMIADLIAEGPPESAPKPRVTQYFPVVGMGGYQGSEFARAQQKYGGFVPVPSDKPSRSQADMDRAIAEAERAAKAVEDWDYAVKEGRREIKENFSAAMAEFADIVGKDATKALDDYNTQMDEGRAEFKSYLAELAQESALLGVTGKQHFMLAELFKVEALATGMSTEEKAAWIAKTQEQAGLFYDMREAAEAAEEAAKEVEAAWKAAADGVERAWAGLWSTFLETGKFKFGEFAKSLKSIWAQTLGEMIAMATRQSIVAPLFQSMFGISGAGAGGVSGGPLAALMGMGGASSGGRFGGGPNPDGSYSFAGVGGIMGGAKLFETSAQKSIFAPLENGINKLFNTKLGGNTIGGMLGGAMSGMMFGGMAGSKTGGAIGGLAGSFLGPIGGIVGGILGGLIGSLFKSTPRSNTAVNIDGGLATLGDNFAKGLSPKIGNDMAKNVARVLNDFAEAIGAELGGDMVGIVGQRGKKFFYQAGGGDLKTAGKKSMGAVRFDSAEEAISEAIDDAIRSGVVKGMSEADRLLYEAAMSVEEGIQDVIDAQRFRKEIDFLYLGLTDPKGEELARLADQYEAQKKLGEKYGADMVKLEAIYQADRLAIIKKYQEDEKAQLQATMKDFLTSLTGGSSSPLSPITRLGLTQANFSTLRTKALGGDSAAIQQIQAAAQDFLSASRDVYGSTAGYFANYNLVVDTVSKLAGVANPLASPQTAAMTAANENTRTLVTQATAAFAQREKTNALLSRMVSALETGSTAAARAAASAPVQTGATIVGSVDWQNAVLRYGN